MMLPNIGANDGAAVTGAPDEYPHVMEAVEKINAEFKWFGEARPPARRLHDRTVLLMADRMLGHYERLDGLMRSVGKGELQLDGEIAADFDLYREAVAAGDADRIRERWG